MRDEGSFSAGTRSADSRGVSGCSKSTARSGTMMGLANCVDERPQF